MEWFISAYSVSSVVQALDVGNRPKHKVPPLRSVRFAPVGMTEFVFSGPLLLLDAMHRLN
jgi:hypothetical protein